ncbi:N(2)-fixation sustaining protein CowN [Siculibacillus lacustris]|uniref:N(2)-fixation sustaining protein CowN n=1 Tax=Siculibacillus lacustris TaxID=1549641 RepID=A0A4Q9VXU2_9HYPH|nr:N(2)-fixation sustaining protein CowN [Siculibacillus lacustris]TBW40754.1 N(2)-fixation sustaining protein CowN [Siculibacillus lacustris]
MSVPSPAAAPDRYVSFRGIDFEANMTAVLGHLRRLVAVDGVPDPFWQRFEERLAAADAGTTSIADRLLLMHSHVTYMSDLFEDRDDAEAIAALAKLERECF